MADFITKKFMDRYGRSGSCNDELAKVLSSYLTDDETGRTDKEKLRDVCAKNEIDMSKWSHLNAGHVRMNLGNVLRGRLKKGQNVTVGNTVVKPD